MILKEASSWGQFYGIKSEIMPKKTHYIITGAILFLTLSANVIWYVHSPLTTAAEKKSQPDSASMHHDGEYIVVHLDNMNLELHDGTRVLATLPLVSQGKPGSYYETIGGSYVNDYKEDLHLSTIGHVYMPYSVHIFGNYFIHGIPYYPDGTKVSNAYSGGCIRLNDDDAKTVYDFVVEGTPIIVTRGDEYDFEKTESEVPTLTGRDMTRLMAATISLEFLTQDDPVIGIDGETTTRRALLPRLLVEKDDAVSNLYASAMEEGDFVESMNDKAKALGLTNTVFTDPAIGVKTTAADYNRFMEYIKTYKTYLLTLDTKTTP
jgi:hypothetical protein